jgi:hypothetical protein
MLNSEEKPPKIFIVEAGDRDPKWNYARFKSMETPPKEWVEPCCLKSKPCWECVNEPQ